MPAASRASSKPSCLSQSRYKPPSNEKMQLLNSSNNGLPRSLNDREERSSCAVKFSPPPKVDLGRLGGVRATPCAAAAAVVAS